MGGAHAIIINSNQEILLIKRRDVPVWTVPGGGQNKNESPKQTAVRETLEESGYKVRVIRKIGEYSQKKRLNHIFVCKIVSGKPTPSNECSDVKFFKTDNLPELISPAVPRWISDYQKDEKTPIHDSMPTVTARMLLFYFPKYPTIVIRYLLVRLFNTHINI